MALIQEPSHDLHHHRVVYPASDRLDLRTTHEIPNFVENQTSW